MNLFTESLYALVSSETGWEERLLSLMIWIVLLIIVCLMLLVINMIGTGNHYENGVVLDIRYVREEMIPYTTMVNDIPVTQYMVVPGHNENLVKIDNKTGWVDGQYKVNENVKVLVCKGLIFRDEIWKELITVEK